MTFDLERLFVRQRALPPDLLFPDRLTNCRDVLDAVVPISRDHAPLFDPLDTWTCVEDAEPVEPVKRTRKRKPTLAGVIRQMKKVGIEIAGCEINQRDGTIKVIAGKPSETTTPDNNNDKDNNEWDGVLQ